METRKIHVKIEGLEPGYMQSRLDPWKLLPEKKKTGSTKGDPRTMQQEIQDKLFLNEKKQPCCPATHFRGSIIDAAKDFIVSGKRGKSYRELVASAVFVKPELAPITPPEWIEDLQAGNNFRVGRIPVARPRFPAGWTAEFDITIEDPTLTDETLKRILDHAGLRKGLGSYTPPHGGPYGRFLVREFNTA